MQFPMRVDALIDESRGKVCLIIWTIVSSLAYLEGLSVDQTQPIHIDKQNKYLLQCNQNIAHSSNCLTMYASPVRCVMDK